MLFPVVDFEGLEMEARASGTLASPLSLSAPSSLLLLLISNTFETDTVLGTNDTVVTKMSTVSV